MKRPIWLKVLCLLMVVGLLTLGMACSEMKGDTGKTGATGATGPTGAQGPAGATGADGVDGIQGERGLTGPVGPQGAAGAAGTGILSVTSNGDGTMTIILTDGSSYVTDNLTGAAGVGVADVVNNTDGTFTITMTDGTAYVTDNFTGPQGPAGEPGAAGEVGPAGEPGAAGEVGPAGEPGPNMIVAMGMVEDYGGGPTVSQSYNVVGCAWDNVSGWYEVTLADITYRFDEYVTVVTPVLGVSASYGSLGSGVLIVQIYDADGVIVQSPFSFMVLGVPA